MHSSFETEQKEFFRKKFSVGLPMDASLSDFESFLDTFGPYLSSIYFSLPLGKRFYSREELALDFIQPKAEEKLFAMLRLIKESGVRTEWAVNNYGITKEDLAAAASYCYHHQIVPDEIVTMAEIGEILKAQFPDAELKYSFNNPGLEGIAPFDSVVVGKKFLRDRALRHTIIHSGKGLVLLLNNGCSFSCHYPCGSSDFCRGLMQKDLEEVSLNELYARQSFFPEELLRLIHTDSMADRYRWKLSTRPLGLDYTKCALSAYIGAITTDALFRKSADSFGYFSVSGVMFQRRSELDYEEIKRIKESLPV